MPIIKRMAYSWLTLVVREVANVAMPQKISSVGSSQRASLGRDMSIRPGTWKTT